MARNKGDGHSWQANTGCQVLLFGEVNDDPGDIGQVFFTLPLFMFTFIAASIALYFIVRERKKL